VRCAKGRTWAYAGAINTGAALTYYAHPHPRLLTARGFEDKDGANDSEAERAARSNQGRRLSAKKAAVLDVPESVQVPELIDSLKSAPTVAQIGPREPAAEWVAISDLKKWAENPRSNDKAVPKVVASIKRFGFGAPILARRADGEIIAGHTRLRAAAQLGLKQVPVRFLDLDPAEAHLLALADNKLGEISEWENQQLAALLGPLYKLHEDAAEVAGWTDEDIEKLLGQNADDILEAADDDSNRVKTDFIVLVECTDEDDQRVVIDKLLNLGLTCRALI